MKSMCVNLLLNNILKSITIIKDRIHGKKDFANKS